ncbi:MAG: glycosyltransferase family 4 protein [Pseudomonadota bacterium]
MTLPAAPRFGLFYHPDGYATKDVQPLGRRVAGEAFFRALACHGGLAEITGLVASQADGEAFVRHVAALNQALPARAATAEQPKLLDAAGTLFIPGPGLAEFAWRRRRHRQDGHSLLGITHTSATTRIMSALADNLTAPVQPWDAVICTSRAVRAMVVRVLEEQDSWLRERLGATRVEWPQLPVLPLGVDAAAFAGLPQARAAWRAELGIAEGDVAVLCVARFSHASKFNPLPLFIALREAQARAPTPRLHLLLAGWYETDHQSALFAEGAATLCPALPIHRIDGRDPRVRREIWSAADIFTLPADNVQESFGIAPVEAMAAGLPVVAGDWDGFRDTIVDGQTGILVPTAMAGPLDQLGLRHEAGIDNFGRYCAAVAQSTALDVARLADAFAALTADAGLRRRMGGAGRQRGAALFDWRVIVPQYLALAAELAAMRAHGGVRAPVLPGRPANPAAQDPFMLFAEYPTARLTPGDRFELPPGTGIAAVERIARLQGAVAQGRLLPGIEEFRRIIAALEEAPQSGTAIAALCPGIDEARVMRGLGWMLKFGLLSRAS